MKQTQRPWTAFYGPSVRKEIDHADYRTVGEMVSAVAHLYASKLPLRPVCPTG